MIIELPKKVWERASECLADLRPDMEMKLLCCDDMLEKLGLCESAPCRISLNITTEEYEDLLEELIDMETAAYNTSDGKDPPKTDPLYQRYLKYGWLWSVLYLAEFLEE